MADSKLSILIDAKNNTSGAIGQVKGELGGLEKTAGIASKSLGALATAGAFAGVAAGLAMVGKGMFSLSQEAKEQVIVDNQLTAVLKSTGGVAGVTAGQVKALSAEIQAATNYGDEATQSAQSLMLTFTKIGSDVFPRATLAAVDMSAAFEQDLKSSVIQLGKALNDPIEGISALSRIGVQFSDSQKQMIDSMMAVNDIAGAQGIILKEVEAQVAGSAAAQKDSIIQLQNAWGDLRQTIGAKMLPGFETATNNLIEVINALNLRLQEPAAFEIPANQLEILASELNQVNMLMGEYQAAGMQDGPEFEAAAAEAARLGTAINVAKASGDAFNMTAAETEARAGAAARASAGLADAHTQAAFATDHFAASMQGLAGITAGTAAAISQARGIALGWIDTLGASGALGKFEEINSQIKDLRQTMFDAGATTDEMDFATASLVEKWRSANDAITTYGKTATAIDSTMDSLTSKVSGLLSSQLDPGVGVNPADFLPREDAINEDARRLADVAVNGYNSPWYSYLNDKFPGMFDAALTGSGGDIQGAAAAMLRDFQAGLRPELLDKEAAKERIKQMLTGDANMAALAAEITKELQAEMGGQYSASAIADATGAALGTGDTAKTGATAAAQMAGGFTSAIADSNAGGKAVTSLLEGIVGKFEDIVKNGESAGWKWFGGFKKAVADAMEGYIPPPPGATSTDPTGATGGTTKGAARAVGAI
jgi:hypothetical protein